jgi:hypothetical protein
VMVVERGEWRMRRQERRSVGECVHLEQGLCRLPPRGIRIKGSLQHLDELRHRHLSASGMWIHRRGGGSSHDYCRPWRKQRAVALCTWVASQSENRFSLYPPRLGQKAVATPARYHRLQVSRQDLAVRPLPLHRSTEESQRQRVT